MAFDIYADRNINAHASPVGECIVLIEFTDDVFGPVKALQLFAAINQLPKSSRLTSMGDERGWSLVINIAISLPTQRVLGKIGTMPAVTKMSFQDSLDGS